MMRDITQDAPRIEAQAAVGDLLGRAIRHGLDAPLLMAAYCHLQVYKHQHVAMSPWAGRVRPCSCGRGWHRPSSIVDAAHSGLVCVLNREKACRDAFAYVSSFRRLRMTLSSIPAAVNRRSR